MLQSILSQNSSCRSIFTNAAYAIVHRLSEKHEVVDIEFLVDADGYLSALEGRELTSQFNYSDRNHI